MDEEIFIRVPVEKKKYYREDIIKSLLSKEGQIAFRKEQQHIVMASKDLKKFKSFVKIIEMMFKQESESEVK